MLTKHMMITLKKQQYCMWVAVWASFLLREFPAEPPKAVRV